MKRAYRYILMAALAFLQVPAYAADPDFVKLVQQPDTQHMIIAAAKQSPVVTQTPCTYDNYTVSNRVVIYRQPVFDSTGKIKEGAWMQPVIRSGCDKDSQLNVIMFMPSNGGALKALPLLPGKTRTDPILQKDALKGVMASAQRPIKKDCKIRYISNTEILTPQAAPTPNMSSAAPWDEMWTVTECSIVAQVIVHFIPDATGTTFSIDERETQFTKK